MNEFAKDVARMLVRELGTLFIEIGMFPDDETLWKTAPGISNSAGNLALHLCGNLNHYIGAVLGYNGYVRDREHEFGARSGSRESLIQNIEETIHVVSTVLVSIPGEVVAATYPEKVAGVSLPCRTFLIHLCSHAGFHLGQVGYLRRILTGDGETSGAISISYLERA